MIRPLSIDVTSQPHPWFPYTPRLNQRRAKRLPLLHIALLGALALCLLITTRSPAHAQATVDAAVLAEPAEVSVGDVFTLTLQVIHPEGSRVTPGQLEDQWGSFEIRRIGSVDTVPLESSSGNISIQSIQATLWQTGTHTTPEFQITVVDSDGNPAQHDVVSGSVFVKSVLQPGDDLLRDIKPQATLPFIPLWQQLLAVALLALIALGGILWWLSRRRSLAPAVTEEKVVVVDNRPADVKALEAIHAVAEEHLPTQRRFAEHYDRITDVLRSYLDDGFDIPALDKTTSELRYSIPSDTLGTENRMMLFRLLEEADLVKFAKVEPEFDTADQLPERARQFVLGTAARLSATNSQATAEGQLSSANPTPASARMPQPPSTAELGQAPSPQSTQELGREE